MDPRVTFLSSRACSSLCEGRSGDKLDRYVTQWSEEGVAGGVREFLGTPNVQTLFVGGAEKVSVSLKAQGGNRKKGVWGMICGLVFVVLQ